MVCTEALLKSFQFGLNERLVKRERKKEDIVNEIHALGKVIKLYLYKPHIFLVSSKKQENKLLAK